MTQPVDFTPALVRWALSLDQARAQVASANIANAHTDGFTPQRVAFEDQLASLQAAADGGTLPEALENARAEGFATAADPAQSLLGSQVNLDDQVANLVSASTDYQSLAEGLNRYFGLLHLAITSQE